jgi:hypothetical protein
MFVVPKLSGFSKVCYFLLFLAELVSGTTIKNKPLLGFIFRDLSEIAVCTASFWLDRLKTVLRSRRFKKPHHFGIDGVATRCCSGTNGSGSDLLWLDLKQISQTVPIQVYNYFNLYFSFCSVKNLCLFCRR